MLSVSVEGDEEDGPLHLGCERVCNVRGARRGMSALEGRKAVLAAQSATFGIVILGCWTVALVVVLIN